MSRPRLRHRRTAAGNDRAAPAGTATRILDVAEALVQSRGFNGFSYADVAGQLGVTKASLHYHYPGKSELGEALINRYAQRFGEALQAIDADCHDVQAKLAAYAALYASVMSQHRMCLCGMLAADYETLQPAMRDSVVRFFDANEAWLAGVLQQGRAEGTLSYAGSAKEQAQLIVSALEGAMLVARPYGDPQRFTATAEGLLATLNRRPVP